MSVTADDGTPIITHRPEGGTFLELEDTPASYVGFGEFNLRVNDAEDAIEFVSPPFDTEFEIFQSLTQSDTALAEEIKLDVTTAIKPAGTYRIGFFSEITNSKKFSLIELTFLVDNVAIHQHTSAVDSLRYVPLDDPDEWLAQSQVHYSVLGIDATIDLAIKFGAGGDIASISNATIEIWRVS